jgi:uncharacterized protein (DUF885 family)
MLRPALLETSRRVQYRLAMKSIKRCCERSGALVILALVLVPGASAAEGERLHDLLDEEWSLRLREDPLLATSVGVHDYDDRLPTVGREDLERRAAARRRFLERLEGIERASLGIQDRISYDMFARQLEGEIANYEFGGHYFPLNADSGFHISFAWLPRQVPLRTVGDYERYIARLEAFPDLMGQYIALLRDGLRRGFSLPRVVLEGYDVTIESHVAPNVTDSVFHSPFQSFPNSVHAEARAALRDAGERAIRDAVIPAYRSFLTFMREEYRPRARTSTGASDLPEGRRYYEHLVRHFTTLDVTPEEVHERGLLEVKRIRTEMDAVIQEIGFQGSFDEFLEFLRTDPRFYAESAEELLKEAAWIAKRMDGRLPSLFKTLPRQPYDVQPVPDEIAPKYTAGRYVGASRDGTEAGHYWVNTYALQSRPLYALEALTFHEAVPGHHLQNALRQELEGLPAFRRFGGVGAYGEGWGLYSERLGLEAGFYTDPYSNFGRLTYEMWRACRLVVDTGLHAFGWTRQQAIDYLASHTALSRHEVTTETDRYIAWPGQALSYKMGELKIRELRERAEERLGTDFDIREFHEVILGNGPVPLTVLDELVEAHIAASLRDRSP